LIAFNEDLKAGNLKQIYLFYGTESYLRRQYMKRYKQAMISDDDNMNYHYYEGNDTSVNSFIDIAETLPFFAERRVIIWENSGFFKTADEKLFAYLKSVSESTSLLFVEAEIDKRSKMFKFVSSLGSAVEFPIQNEDMLKRWIGTILKKENKKITERTAIYLLDKVGTDMEKIHSEMEKLVSYCLDRDVITETDIDAICTTHINNQIFDMVSAVAERKQKQALKLYHDLLTLKEPPMRILFLLARQFNLLMQVKELKSRGFDNKSIGLKVSLPGFVVGKYAQAAEKFKTADLKEAVNNCINMEEAVKTGNLNDRMSIELIIIKYSGFNA